MAKGGLARERFKLKQQRNRIIGQLNQLKAEGFSTDQIRAAGKNAFQTLAGTSPKQITVADGDTLSTIAQNNGTTEADILAANPELKNVRTGMVITAPSSLPGSPGWLDQNRDAYPGGVGLPSNAALGGTTNNPQGNNPFGNLSGSAGFVNPYAQREANTYNALSTNASAQPYQYKAPSGPIYVPPGLSQQQYRTAAQTTTLPGSPEWRDRNIEGFSPPPKTPSWTPGYQYFSRTLFHNQLRTKIETGYVPSGGEMKILETMGFIKKNQGGGYGGFGGKKKKRGGGGGGTPKAPSYGYQERQPAFSTGSGFGGLVNWRI